jgi:hypothetical protein
MRPLSLLTLAIGLAPLAGCHSAFIDATISNRSAAPVSLVELDYPSASLGTQTLAPGADFHYRFKVLGQGATTLLWTDAAHHDHKATGPNLTESDDGRLTVTITSGEPTWAMVRTTH